MRFKLNSYAGATKTVEAVKATKHFRVHKSGWARDREEYGTGWIVSHASGLRINRFTISHKRVALKIAAEIEALFDWSKASVILTMTPVGQTAKTKGIPKTAGAKVKAILQAHGCDGYVSDQSKETRE